MDLFIKKDKRNNGNHFIKMPYGISSDEAKNCALKDISQLEKNYIYMEFKILYSIQNNKCIININIV